MLGAKWLTGVAFRGEYENPSHSGNNEVKGFTLTLKHHYNLRNPKFCFNLHFSWTWTYFLCPKYYTHYMQKGMACFSICTFPVLTNTQGKHKHGNFSMTIKLTFYRSCADERWNLLPVLDWAQFQVTWKPVYFWVGTCLCTRAIS